MAGTVLDQHTAVEGLVTGAGGGEEGAMHFFALYFVPSQSPAGPVTPTPPNSFSSADFSTLLATGGASGPGSDSSPGLSPSNSADSLAATPSPLAAISAAAQALGTSSSSSSKVELKATSLDVEAEQKLALRRYIAQRTERNLVYEAGSLGILPMLLTKHKVSGSTSCFYAAVNLPSATGGAAESSVATQSSQSTTGSSATSSTSSSLSTTSSSSTSPQASTVGKVRYVLCLVSLMESEGFGHFRNDLERFARNFGFVLHLLHVNTAANGIQASTLLSTGQVAPFAPIATTPALGKVNFSDSELKDYLASWPTLCIEYLVRAVEALEGDLDVFLHAALIGKSIVVSAPNPKAEDLIRLAEAIHLTSESPNARMSWSGPTPGAGGSASGVSDLIQFLAAQAAAASNGSDKQQTPSQLQHDSLVITWAEGTGRPELSTKETNEFCRTWATKLRALAQSGAEPSKIRASVEQTKVQVNQELNHVKRLVDMALIDNYALYEAFLYLKANANKDVLLVQLLKDVHNDPNTREVLEVIYDYLTDANVIPKFFGEGERRSETK